MVSESHRRTARKEGSGGERRSTLATSDTGPCSASMPLFSCGSMAYKHTMVSRMIAKSGSDNGHAAAAWNLMLARGHGPPADRTARARCACAAGLCPRGLREVQVTQWTEGTMDDTLDRPCFVPRARCATSHCIAPAIAPHQAGQVSPRPLGWPRGPRRNGPPSSRPPAPSGN